MKQEIRQHLLELSQKDCLPLSHFKFLQSLKQTYNFTPSIVYDIGSCVLHWTNKAKQIWPDAEYVLYDAFDEASFLYDGYKHYSGVLSDNNDKVVKFYQNEYNPGGNSYYREIGCQNGSFFPVEKYIEKPCRTLDSIIEEKHFPAPDLIKIDVQGAEMDILIGAKECLKTAKFLIVEMQHTNYNDDAPKVEVTKPFIESLGWTCIAEKFSDNGPDADYCFMNNLHIT